MQRDWANEEANEERKRKRARRLLKPALQKWLEEKQDQYSIEPVIIKRFERQSETEDSDSESETENSTDVYVFPLGCGSLEIKEELVETFVIKPIDGMVDKIVRDVEEKNIHRSSALVKNLKHNKTISSFPIVFVIQEIFGIDIFASFVGP